MAGREDVELTGLDYVVKVPYNGTGMAGGDPLKENLNIWYEVRDAPSLSGPQTANRERVFSRMCTDRRRLVTSHGWSWRRASSS